MKDAKRKRLHTSLLAETSVSKSALARLLKKLDDHDALANGVLRLSDAEAIRKDLGDAATDFANRQTPSGTLVQSMDLLGNLKWHFIEPAALMHVLATDSEEFRNLMVGIMATRGSEHLGIVIFMDECTPGNVMRPDNGRELQHVLWTLVEFPDWLSVRDEGWFTFGCCRSSLVDRVGVSRFLKHVVKAFNQFASTGSIVCGKIVKAKIVGILGDEKGMKEGFSSKGASATRSCLSCKNVVQFLDDHIKDHPYLVPISCSDPARFDRSTDDEVYEAADHLIALADGPRSALELAQQTLGLTFVRDGLLFDLSMRNSILPITHWLRDWMHTMAVAGNANVELQQIIRKVRAAGVSLEQMQAFIDLYNLPKAYGKVHSEWLSIKRVGKGEERDGWKGFSGEVITLVPLMLDFLLVVVVPLSVVDPAHVECFRLLDKLLKLFKLGPRSAAARLADIEITIQQHGDLFVQLYKDVVKPKFHYLYHIPDHIRSIGKLLSCFATERRHRTAKTPAAYIFNHFESTLTKTQLCRIVGNLSATSFVPTYLLNRCDLPAHAAQCLQEILPGLSGPCSFSASARLLCGTVHRGDVVMLTNKRVGDVMKFFDCTVDGVRSIWLLVGIRFRINDQRHSIGTDFVQCVSASDVIDTLVWAPDGDYIRVLLPSVSATW